MGLRKGETIRSAFEEYSVEGTLGAGGSGEVYRVLDADKQAFAAKVLDPSKANKTRLKRFKNEINFCSKNNHKNIVQVLGTGLTDKGATFYIMPIYGCTLRDLISKGIKPGTVLHFYGQILDGIEAAHLRQVWHRDIKPANILCTSEGNLLVIADFGIAHFEEDEILTLVDTNDNERLANFQYSAPEQRVRGQVVDGKADVYAAGLILNEMFTGTVPQGTQFRKIGEVAPDYSYLDGLVDFMLRQEAAQRPSVQDVKRELIARGSEFLSLQRLDALKKEVIPETEITDPIVANPITVLGVDYRDSVMIFKLSAIPPPQWIREFQNPRGSFSYYPSATPAHFTINGSDARVSFGLGIDAQRLADYTRSYVDSANRQYQQFLISQNEQRLASERAALKRKIEEEERRQQILSSVKV